MAVHITTSDANAWLEATKLSVTTIEEPLETQIVAEVFGKLRAVFDISTWVNDQLTPDLIRALISMYYVAAIYDRTYSDNSEDTTSNYAWILRKRADANIKGLVEGDLFLPDPDTGNQGVNTPAFYPNDASSLGLGYAYDKSETAASFSMGEVF